MPVRPPARSSSSGRRPDRLIRSSILQAIEAYTAGSAFQAFDDDAGSLNVGARADVVVLDQDITAIAGTEVAGEMVDETWMNGTRVFHR